jgi:acyl-CoA thioesterase
MEGSDRVNTPEELVLTQLQREGITTKLANNPVVEFMGIQLVEVIVGGATLMLPGREEYQNSMGVLQGGIVTVLADVAGGVSLYSVLTDPMNAAIPTVEFKLNFLRPAGREDLFARGRVVHRGRQIAVCQVDTFFKAETLLATGIFTYMIRPQSAKRMAKSTGHGDSRF